MPFVNVKLMDGAFSSEEKHAMAAALTDVMVRLEGLEAFREVVWVLIEELHIDGWHIGGQPFMAPKSVMDNLQRSKTLFESIDERAHRWCRHDHLDARIGGAAAPARTLHRPN